jgi:hypothetical protein
VEVAVRGGFDDVSANADLVHLLIESLIVESQLSLFDHHLPKDIPTSSDY